MNIPHALQMRSVVGDFLQKNMGKAAKTNPVYSRMAKCPKVFDFSPFGQQNYTCALLLKDISHKKRKKTVIFFIFFTKTSSNFKKTVL